MTLDTVVRRICEQKLESAWIKSHRE